MFQKETSAHALTPLAVEGCAWLNGLSFLNKTKQEQKKQNKAK